MSLRISQIKDGEVGFERKGGCFGLQIYCGLILSREFTRFHLLVCNDDVEKKASWFC
jgi:hypothetical protein